MANVLILILMTLKLALTLKTFVRLVLLVLNFLLNTYIYIYVPLPRIIQNYVVREEAGTLASDVMDANKVSAVCSTYPV